MPRLSLFYNLNQACLLFSRFAHHFQDSSARAAAACVKCAFGFFVIVAKSKKTLSDVFVRCKALKRTLNLRKNMCLWSLVRRTRSCKPSYEKKNSWREKPDEKCTVLLCVVQVNKYIIVIRCKFSVADCCIFMLTSGCCVWGSGGKKGESCSDRGVASPT